LPVPARRAPPRARSDETAALAVSAEQERPDAYRAASAINPLKWWFLVVET
jgi:hypothetical protein